MFKWLRESLIGETYGGGFHKPDPRDHKADHVIGGVDGTALPDSVLMLTAADNQGGTVHCSTYASYHACKIANEMEHKIKINDLPERGWALQTAYGTSSVNGDYIQSALQSLRDNGYQTDSTVYPIDGFAGEDILEDKMKARLAQGYALIVLSPVTKTNFVSARDTGIWTGLDGTETGNHFTVICGYEAGFFTALNSYGSMWGKFSNGTYKVPMASIKDLKCCYLVYDRKDLNYLFKDVTDKSPCFDAIKWAKDNGVMKGYADGSFRPDQPITRAEAAQILYNKFKI